MENAIETVKRWSKGRKSCPALAELTLTYRCNLGCEFCNIPLSQASQTKEREIDFISVIESLLKKSRMQSTDSHPTFFLTGGEPFLRNDLLSIMTKIKKSGCTGLLVTNGTLMGEDKAEKIVNMGWDQLIFSIDGLEETHDSLRGKKGAFRATKRNIKYLNNLKQDKGAGRPRIQISTVLTEQNIGEVPQIARLAADLDAYLIEFSELRRLTDEANKMTISVKDDSARKNLIKARKILEKNSVEHNISYLLEEGRSNPAESSKEKSSCLGSPLCYAPWYQISINPYGKTAPCSVLIDDESCSFTTDGSDPSDVWYKDFDAVRRKMFADKPLTTCAECCMPYEKQNQELNRQLTSREKLSLSRNLFDSRSRLKVKYENLKVRLADIVRRVKQHIISGDTNDI